MSDSKQPQSRAESINEVYKQRVANLEQSEAKDADDLAEADNLEHDLHDLNDEQKFVGGVDVKKDAESEEDFLPTPAAEETVDKSVEEPAEDKQEPAKPAPAKKTAAKK